MRNAEVEEGGNVHNEFDGETSNVLLSIGDVSLDSLWTRLLHILDSLQCNVDTLKRNIKNMNECRTTHNSVGHKWF